MDPGRFSMKDRFARALAWSSIVLVAVAQLWPGLSTDLSPPIGWDHGSHLGKAILTWNHLLPSLRGWTDLEQAGVPLNTVYGPAGLIWVLLFRCITPFLEWHQTYALAFCGFRVLVGACVYRLTRVLGAGRVGGVAAAMLALADAGTHSEGGWFYDVLYGVWPMSLAMCVLFFGLADLIVFVENGPVTTLGRRARARAMVLLGIALFSHQMCLIAIAMIVPILLIVRVTDGRGPGMTRETLARVVPVVIVAAMIASWWMLPMLGLSAYLDDHGQLCTTTLDIGERMIRAEGVWGGGTWEGVLVSLGLVSSLFARGSRRFVAVLAVCATIVYSCGWFLTFDAARWLPPLGRIVFPRMLMIGKPLYFALAGMVVHDVLVRVGPSLRAVLAKPSGIVGAVLTLALIAPFAPGMPGALAPLLWRRDVTTTATMSEWNDFQAAWIWVGEQPRDRFYRVAYVNDWMHLGQAAPAYTDRPGYTPGVYVGEAFRNTPDGLDPDMLREINVRYVLAFGALPARLDRQCTEVRRFGAARLCELRDWTSAVVTDTDGARHPLVSHLEDARVVFDPDGARSVVVHRAMAPGWAATADGQDIPITEERVVDSAHLRLMRLTIPEGAHEVVLHYRATRALDVLGMLATLLGLLAVIVLASRRPRVLAMREATWARITTRVPPRTRELVHAYWPTAVIVLPLVAFALVIARNARGTHLAYHLDGAVIRRPNPMGDEVCEDHPAAGGTRCPSLPQLTIDRTAMCIDGRYHSCIAAGPAPGSPLRFTWTDLPLSGTLTLAGGVADAVQARQQGGMIHLRALANDEEFLSVDVPNGWAWEEGAAPIPEGTRTLDIEVVGSSPGQRELCIDAVIR